MHKIKIELIFIVFAQVFHMGLFETIGFHFTGKFTGNFWHESLSILCKINSYGECRCG
jgi:hypothetical protein